MKRFYLTGGASIQVLHAATTPATDARASVHRQRVPCVTDLSKLASPAPFLCSVRGFVADRGEVAQARNGVDMRSFHLVDAKGQYVRCLACGEHAASGDFGVGNEVSVFFARATLGRSEAEHGKLWLYYEAVVLLHDAARASPRKRTEIRILNG